MLRTLGVVGLAGPLAGCATTGRPTAVGSQPDVENVAPAPLDAVRGGWPLFQFDVRNTGRSPTAAGPRDPPAVRWRTSLGTGAASGPALGDGLLVVPSTDGVLFGLDARHGGVRWRRRLGVGTAVGHQSMPAVVENTVHVGDSRGRVHALDPVDGATRWTTTTGGAVDGSPTVVDGLIYVGSDDGRLYALDASDGTVSWSAPIGGDVGTAPAVDDGRVIVGSANGRVSAVAAAGGTRLWTFQTGDSVTASPAVADGRVFVGSKDGRLYALDAATGEEVWARFFPFAGVAQTAALAADLVLVSTQSFQLHAVDAETGREVWNFTTGQVGWPVVADDTVFVAGATVRALDLGTGEPLWTRQRRGVGLAVADGALFVPTSKGDVLALAP